MKYIIAFLLAFSLSPNANADDVPSKYMKDAVITVTLKSGKTYTYSANEYKVVRRGTSKPPVIVMVTGEMKPTAMPEVESHKNRVSLVVGYGLNGKLDDKTTSSTVDIEQKKGAVGGLVYQRDLNKEYHFMGGAMTNSTFFLGFGKGF